MSILLLKSDRRIYMSYELNKSLSENLGVFLSEFKDEVVKGLQELLLVTNNFSLEII